MLPRCAMNHTPNSLYNDMKILSQCLVGHAASGISLANSTNVRLGKFSHAVGFALATCPVLDSIGVVFPWCSPLQVLKSIVGWITVKMSTLHTLGARADKREKNQPVNLEALFVSIARQGNMQITPPLVNIGLQLSPSTITNFVRHGSFFLRPHLAIITNTVIRKTFNLTILDTRGRIVFSHDSSPFAGVVREPVGPHTLLALVL